MERKKQTLSWILLLCILIANLYPVVYAEEDREKGVSWIEEEVASRKAEVSFLSKNNLRSPLVTTEQAIQVSFDKVRDYYISKGEDTALEVPLEGSARFAVGLRPSENSINSGVSFYTEKRVNDELGKAELIWDLIACGKDPSSVEEEDKTWKETIERDYIYELWKKQGDIPEYSLLPYKSSLEPNGRFEKAMDYMGISDGVGSLVMATLWGDHWIKEEEEDLGKESFEEAVVSSWKSEWIEKNLSDVHRFQNAMQWGVKNDPDNPMSEQQITFINNFYLLMGLSWSNNDEVEQIREALASNLKSSELQKDRCEFQAASIIAALYSPQGATKEQWENLFRFQKEDGSFARQKGGDTNEESTVWATLALDAALQVKEGNYEKFLVFYRLADELSQERRSEIKESIENFYDLIREFYQELKREKESFYEEKESILNFVKDRVPWSRFSGTDISTSISPEGYFAQKKFYQPQTGEPDNASLSISFEFGDDKFHRIRVQTNFYTLMPEDKTVDPQGRVHGLREFYRSSYHKWVPYSFVAGAGLFEQVPEEALPFLNLSQLEHDRRDAICVMDAVAAKQNPRRYPKTNLNTGEMQYIDLVDRILSSQDEDGTLMAQEENLLKEVEACLAMDIYFGQNLWGNEKEETKLGRLGAIERILSSLEDISEIEEGRGTVTEQGNYIKRDSLLAILLSRWTEDKVTIVNVNGRDEILGDVAQREMDQVMNSLIKAYLGEYEHDSDWESEQEVDVWNKEAVLQEPGLKGVPLFLSALVATGRWDKVEELEVLQYLRNFGNSPQAIEQALKDNKMDVELDSISIESGDFDGPQYVSAMSDYESHKCFLKELSDTTQLEMSDEEAVESDVERLILPSVADKDLVLPDKGIYETLITWYSSDEQIISSSGKVSRPVIGEPDAIVTLTAEVQRGRERRIKEFIITIPSLKSQASILLQEDLKKVEVPVYTIEDLNLKEMGENGTKFIWLSSNPEILAHDGRINRQNEDCKVTLTLTGINGSESANKTFVVIIGKLFDENNVVEKAVSKIKSRYRRGDYLGSYWEVWAAKSVLNEEFDSYDFQIWDVATHKEGGQWNVQDCGVIILQILAQGDNPYNYHGVNYVKLLEETWDKQGGGGWAMMTYTAMALDAAAAPPKWFTHNGYVSAGEGYEASRKNLENGWKAQLKDLRYGADLAGWALVPLATYAERFDKHRYDDEVGEFINAMKKYTVREGKYTGLFDTVTAPDAAGIIPTLSTGCVVSGFSAWKAIGFQGVDLTTEEWKVNGVGPLDTMYKLGVEELGETGKFSSQIDMEFGEVYYGDSLWRRIAVSKEQFERTIAEAQEILLHKEDYTQKSAEMLQQAYEEAVKTEKDEELMGKWYFGEAYFNLKSAVDNLKKAKTSSLSVIGTAQEETLIKSLELEAEENKSVEEQIREALIREGHSISFDKGKVVAIDGKISEGKASWLVYEQREGDVDANRVSISLEDYVLPEGSKLILKYTENTEMIGMDWTLNRQLVQESAEHLSVEGAINSQNEVTGNLKLKNIGAFGTSISWYSDKQTVIEENGRVNRTDYNSGVTLTAKVSYRGVTKDKMFSVVVLGTQGGVAPHKDIAYIQVNGPVSTGEIFYSKRELEIEEGETAFSLLLKTGLSVDYEPNTKYGVYVKGINGLQEFDYGNESGWLYRVNGSFPGYSAALQNVKGGDFVEWLYTTDLGRDVGGYVAGVEGSTDSSFDDRKLTPQVKDSIARLPLGEVFQSILSRALNEVQGRKDPVISLDMRTKQALRGLELPLDKESLDKLTSREDLSLAIKSDLMDLHLDNKTLRLLQKVQKKTGAEVELSIKKIGNWEAELSKLKNLTAQQRKDILASIKGRPVFDIDIQTKEGELRDLQGGRIGVKLPYKLQAGEDKDKLKVWRIGEDGKIEEVSSSYDAIQAVMSFETDHLSYYAIGEEIEERLEETKKVQIVFGDVQENAWYAKAVYRLAREDILRGKEDGNFHPESRISRAEFVTLLKHLSKEGSSVNVEFKDVKEGTWYHPSVAWAVEHAIAAGYGEEFRPNANITREEMAVMLDRFVKNYESKEAEEREEKVFADEESISVWAKTSVTKMQQRGVIEGKEGGRFAPKENATRAEAAQMIYALLEK